jgi:magnesium transporter
MNMAAEKNAPMLRSLVAPANCAEEIEFTLRRNLTQEALEAALLAGDLVWIDVTNPTDDEIRWLESCLKLHPAVVNDLRREDNRPSLLIYPEYLFVSMFQAHLKLNKVESDEVHCLMGENFFVTVRFASSTAVDSAYDRAAQNADYWRRGVTYMLYLTSQFIIDSYYPLLDRINNQLNKLEESVMINRDKVAQQSVYRIKQQLINLRQMVGPQREVLSNVIGEERLARNRENRDLFRHLYERLLRIYDVIDSQRDLTSNVLDLIEGQESARLANAVSRLTVLSMIFLPLTFLIGLFGLNFVTTEPEFVIALPGVMVFLLILLVTLVGGGLMAWFFRKQGWL